MLVFLEAKRRKNEILQMTILEPTLAILDETDSGLDIDAIKIVSDGVNSLRSKETIFFNYHSLPTFVGLYKTRLCTCFN